MRKSWITGCVDTNLLVYTQHRKHRYFQKAVDFYSELAKTSKGVVTVQNLMEFYATVTDKKRFSKPHSKQIAKKEIDKFGSAFPVLYPTTKSLSLFFKLARKQQAQEIYDVFLAATLLSHGVKVIYTLNLKDFAKISQIEAINPFS